MKHKTMTVKYNIIFLNIIFVPWNRVDDMEEEARS